ncbi:MAG: hypothetical protein RLZZ352_265 [Pseudomonadota bacterium]|jgi:hypothetical protein
MLQSIPKTPAALASEIHIKALDTPAHFLLLEGDFDLRFWETRLNQRALRPVECGGKSTVLHTLQLLQGQVLAPRVLGLVDADFDRLLGHAPPPRVVLTDETDLETSLLLLQCSQPTQMSMERLLAATVDAGKRTAFERQQGCTVVEQVRHIASQFGVLRLLNEQQGWCISFEKMSVLNPQWFDRASLTLRIPDLHQAFLSKLREAGHDMDQHQLATLIQACAQHGWLSGWQLVQGHDLMAVLVTAMNSESLRRAKGHQQVSETSLQRDLLLLHWQDVQHSSMIQHIQSAMPKGRPCFNT